MLLTRKECNSAFPAWTNVYQYTFEAIKRLVVSRDCLMMINHESPGENKIFVTCDASKRHTGVVLLFGPTWEMACPVTFESWQLNSTEQNYPVHKQEMLSIMRAMWKWRVDLLGSHINIFTDHKTLQNFDYQRDLSQQQARWMEYLSQYEYTITYINSDHNTMADALSRLPDTIGDLPEDVDIAAVLSIESNPKLIRRVKQGYHMDSWCKGILQDLKAGMLNVKLDITLKNGLLFTEKWLIIL